MVRAEAQALRASGALLVKPKLSEPLGPPGGSLGGHLEAILAPLAPPGGPLGSKYLPGPSLDRPRALQESLLEALGADLWTNLSPLGANLGPTWAQLEPT